MKKTDFDAPLVLVEWEDSTQPVPQWKYLADYEKAGAVKCASVGWLIQDDKHTKALAPNIGDLGTDDSAQASGVIRIPVRCITRIVRLKERR